MTPDPVGRIADALERIATALEVWVGAGLPTEEAPSPCVHPDDARVSFGVTNGIADWSCKVCGYRTVETETWQTRN